MGPDAYNLNLSGKRAASIVRYLIGTGVLTENLESNGYGESLPIASNETEAGREKNRRVQFNLKEVEELNQ